MIGYDGKGKHTFFLSLVIVGVFLLKSYLSLRMGESKIAMVFYLNLTNWGSNYVWTWVTGIISHANMSHLGSNLLFLILFGTDIEEEFNNILFYIFFFLFLGISSEFFAAFYYNYVLQLSKFYVIGASGGIAGFLGYYSILNPQENIHEPLFNIPYMNFTYIFVFYSIFAMIYGLDSQTAHMTHLTGVLVGVLLGLLLKERKPLVQYLNVIVNFVPFMNYKRGFEYEITETMNGSLIRFNNLSGVNEFEVPKSATVIPEQGLILYRGEIDRVVIFIDSLPRFISRGENYKLVSSSEFEESL